MKCDEVALAGESIVSSLVANWDYARHFDPPSFHNRRPFVDDANQVVDRARVDKHEFFKIALEDPEALKLWVSQECIVTGPFSQFLLLLGSQIENVHLRGAFMEVASGEHNGLKDGIAAHSHPWLLHRLSVSVGLVSDQIQPLPFTISFLRTLASQLGNVMTGLGAIGVGNERLLISEYSAVKECFQASLPSADYRAFLMANIAEDTGHASIMEELALQIALDESDERNYVCGAEVGVEARLKYYDELVEYHQAHAR